MGSIPVPVTKKKRRHSTRGVCVFCCARHNLEPSAHTATAWFCGLCEFRQLFSFLRFIVRLGSHTATGGILRYAALFVFIAIRGTLPANSPRAADSRTSLPLGFSLSSDLLGLTKSFRISPSWQYTAFAVCTNEIGTPSECLSFFRASHNLEPCAFLSAGSHMLAEHILPIRSNRQRLVLPLAF
jgi:hypothetical protein